MNLKPSGRSIFLAFWDVFATYLALTLAAYGTNQAADIFTSTDVLFVFGIMAACNLGFLLALRLYNSLWEYASTREALQLVLATAGATFLGALVHFLVGGRLPIRVYLVAWILFLFFSGAARFAFRYFSQGKSIMNRRLPAAARPRTLVVGAGETGSLTIRRMTDGGNSMPGLPIVAVDDNKEKIGKRIHGVKVAGDTGDIINLVLRHQIEQIVLAIPSASTHDRQRIFGICIQTGCHLYTLPNVRHLAIDELEDVRLREVDVADLLSRDEVVLDTQIVSGYLAGKCVLITGGGGSIGAELARQICLVAPRQVVIFDIYENTAYELEQELKMAHDNIEIKVEIGSVREEERLQALFERYRPDVVFHAAAHKHVPLMEANPREAVLNNVFGTLNVVKCACDFGVHNFIFISTDKAVNPSSVMGATKRLGEMIVQCYNSISDTVFSAVRFGNVLGSHGSVIPFFKQQIANGGPVTITHPDITRFFMTIPESARLVVTAGGMATGGEIFILNMGEPIRIDDLARKLINLSGLEIDKDIQIKYIGLREGEKLNEELLMHSETTIPTEVADIMISTSEPVSQTEVDAKIKRLTECIEAVVAGACDEVAIKRCLADQVPTYTPQLHAGDCQ